MIFKSYLVEQNPSIIKNNLILFYGENIGLINHFKKIINIKNKDSEIIKLQEEEIINNKDNFFSEIKMQSMFHDSKVYIIDNVSDKLLNIIENIYKDQIDHKIFLFTNILNKRSKLRNFFEKQKKTDIIPCYYDNEETLKRFIISNLKDFKNLNANIINTLIANCSNDRTKIQNEIDKIKIYFEQKKIDLIDLFKLLNLEDEDDFNKIKNSALAGNKIETNKLLNNTNFENEKSIMYLMSINHRLNEIKEVLLMKKNLEIAINAIKPPIFWKEKPIFIQQVKVWNEKKINKALRKNFNIELQIKSSSNIDKNLIIKNYLVDVCNLANAA